MLKNVKNNCQKIRNEYPTCSIFASDFKPNNQMKKVVFILSIAVVALVTSCGPSAKEKEAKRIADSTRVADSLAMVMAQQQKTADSIAQVQMIQKKAADSIAHADSVAKKLIKPAKAAKAAKPAHKK